MDGVVRISYVQMATEELWVKMEDMQAGPMALSAVEWGLALDRLVKMLDQLRSRGETVPSSTNGSY